jgi:DHA2 family multidrug resistance protein
VPAVLVGIFGFGVMATSFVLPNYLTAVQGLRALQISDALYWVALPQIVLVPLVALLVQRIDARLLLTLGFAVIAVGSWLDTGLTHDWASGNFVPSAAVEAVGLALAITALITYAIANITPPQAAAIAATIQIARLLGSELGNALMQTFVRVREQVYSNLIGLHLVAGSPAAEHATALLSGPYVNRAVGAGNAPLQGVGVLAGLVRREAYVLADIDAFWLIAWVALAGILLVLLLRRPPPNPLTPPRIAVSGQ